MAKKTTRKKTAGKKTRAASASRRKKTASKTTRKKTGKKKKKKASSRKKAASARSRKKTTTKSRAAGKKTARRKSSKKKATGSKKRTKKAASKVKSTSSTSKKTTTKKKKTTSKGRSAASKASKGAAAANGSAAPAKTAKSSRSSKSGKSRTPGTAKIQRGRSVVEVATTATADAQGYVVINGRRVRMISTKNAPQKKKKRRTADTQAVAAAATSKPARTKLNKRELNKYKKLLLIKRAEIVGDLSAMEAEALRSSDGDLSNMPIHMADLGSDTYEQDFMLGMAESERQRIREIDEALARIEDRTYGICQMTGEQIPTARLEAKPWAKYTIEAARMLEGTWGR